MTHLKKTSLPIDGCSFVSSDNAFGRKHARKKSIEVHIALPEADILAGVHILVSVFSLI